MQLNATRKILLIQNTVIHMYVTMYFIVMVMVAYNQINFSAFSSNPHA